jgi:DNA replication and repair protein RecF
MTLDSLKLLNFKNYSHCVVDFNPNFNFIYGDNGNGKTNILEAISLLCLTRSFLQNSESNCVKFGENCFEIFAELYSASNTKNNVRFSFQSDSLKKEISFNGKVVQKFNSFFGTLPLVVLSPSDLKITTGTTSEKRRNFDIIISQINRSYFNDLKDLTRIVKQKNSLLKENFYYKKYDKEHVEKLLGSWNEKLVDVGVKIMMKRIEFLNEFQFFLNENFKKIVGAQIIPSLEYRSEIFEYIQDEQKDENCLREIFHRILSEKMNLELSRGVSLIGPHRDNYVFSISKNGDSYELRSFASQGEHKTFIVALKISEYHYLKEKLNNTNMGDPVILLDDLFSELDESRIDRIAFILTELDQVFLTTTVKGNLNIIRKHFQNEKISSFYVSNGTAQRIS